MKIIEEELKVITRDDLCEVVKDIYGDIDKFLDDVEEDCTIRFNVFCTINECPGNGDILILDNETRQYISWYKLSHIGRDLHTNIPFKIAAYEFIKAFKECKDKERE